MGTLYLFSLVSLRAFVNFRTCNPLVHVSHLVWTIHVWDVFLMKKGCLPGFSFVGGPRDTERILVTIKINVFRPAIGLAVSPLRSTFLTLLAEAGMRWA